MPWLERIWFRHSRWIAGPAAIVLLALVFLTVWAHSRVDRLQMERDLALKQQQRLGSQIAFLSAEGRRSSTLREVEQRARDDLRLRPLDPTQITRLALGPVAGEGRGEWEFLVPEARAASGRLASAAGQPASGPEGSDR